MNLVTLDFETYWSPGYSLPRLGAIEYVMADEFEVISCAIKVGAAPAQVFFGEDVGVALSRIDWPRACVVAHNMGGFDAYILAWRYGHRPRMWADTLAMARPWYAKDVGLSLGALVEHLGIGVKDNRALLKTKGKRLADFTEAERAAMAEYNAADAEQCYALFSRLRPRFSNDEMLLIDMTIRMAIYPVFVLDQDALAEALRLEKLARRDSLLALGAALAPGETDPVLIHEGVRQTLASGPKFAAFLQAQGVDPPTKVSPNTGNATWAFAKTDEAFVALTGHSNPLVSAAARARLGVKSTLLETRLEKFITAGSLCAGRLPVPLRYCGATTTGRWSGEIHNAQNLPRITPGQPRNADALRRSVMAPPGHRVVVADLSGIELRVNHFLWKVPSSMSLFCEDPEHADLYRQFAARLFQKPVEDVTKADRQVGKVAHLGLGYGAGWVTFQQYARTTAGLALTDAEAREIVTAWRAAYPEIVCGWRRAGDSLPSVTAGGGVALDPWGFCVTAPGAVTLPSGRIIQYPGLRRETDEKGQAQWTYQSGNKRPRLYGSRVVENCVQAIARDILAGQTLEYWRRTRRRPALMVHDELVYVVPEGEAEAALAELLEVLRAPLPWWPEIALWAEGGIGQRYSEAK
jgi:DNA polymerase